MHLAKVDQGATFFFAKDSKWGGDEKDATLFDITITRTEINIQNFYSVVPDPTSLGTELTKEEKAEADKLGNLIDSIVTKKEDVDPDEVELPSEKNPEKQEDFIKSLEEDKKNEV